MGQLSAGDKPPPYAPPYTAALPWRRPLRVLAGRNPWPGAGVLGHAALFLMVYVALIDTAGTGFGLAAGESTHLAFFNDFVAYLTGALLLIQHQAPGLYSVDAQWAAQSAIQASVGAAPAFLNTYVNPPLLAALLMPLWSLGLPAATWLWELASLLGAGGVLLLLGRGETVRPTWRPLLLVLAFFPFVDALQEGNMAAVLLAVFGLWLLFSRRRADLWAGLALSLLLLKPQYAPFPLLYLLWKRQWRQLGGFALGAVVQAVTSVAVMAWAGGFPSMAGLLPFLSFGAGDSNALLFRHVSLRAAIWLLLPNAPSLLQYSLLTLLTVAACVWFLRLVGRGWWPERPDFVDEALILAVATNLTAYHNHLSGLSLLLPPAALLLARPAQGSIARTTLALALAVPSLGVLFNGLAGVWVYTLTGWACALLALDAALGAPASSRVVAVLGRLEQWVGRPWPLARPIS